MVDDSAQDVDALLMLIVHGVNKLIIDGICDERIRQGAEVLLQSGCDRIDVEVGVGKDGLVLALKGFFDRVGLGLASRLAIDALAFHACYVESAPFSNHTLL